jgi:DNA-binding NtrC family response regulator
LVALVWQRTERLRETALLGTAIPAVQAAAWGLALHLAARAGPAGRPAFDAAANLGAGCTAVAALVALARVTAPAGLLTGHRAARSLDAAAFAAFLWGIAVALPATRALFPGGTLLDPLAIDYATSAAAVGSTLVLSAAAGRMVLLRGLELGVGDRARGALTLALTGGGVAVASSVVYVAAPDRVLPAVLTATALAVTWACATRDPASVSMAIRGLLAVVVLGVPSGLFTLWFARRLPDALGPVILVGSGASLIAGLIARAVARPLGPESSRWLDAVHGAMDKALLPEPESALRATLRDLRRAEPMAEARPELWRRDPPGVLHVDVAGYLHESAAEFPERILELALEEPERTLRAATLATLQVRRPELRPLLGWYQSHRALCATALVDGDGPVGLLVMPQGKRHAALSLEEVRALRALGDRMTGLLSVSSAMARSRQRELDARHRAERVESERAALATALEAEERRRTAEAESFAEPVRSTAHGPAARMALQELERVARQASRAILRAPAGADARAWAAVFHLASPRRTEPFVPVDCASLRARSLESWQDQHNSPLQRSAGGTLVLEDPAALPEATQAGLALLLARHQGGVVVASQLPLELDGARLSAELAQQLAGPELRIPSLEERAEDLQSLVLFELSAAGLRLRGEPLGIAPHALRLLTEHSWPGNELELRALLRHAAARAGGPLVTVEDLLTSGLPFAAPTAPLEVVAPAPTERRQRARRAPRSRA